MKIAVIDLGTNTFHLIIADQDDNETRMILKINRPVKLGEDITRDDLIIPAAFERGIACLREFREIINDHQVQIIKAVATSGVRSAKNGNAFIETAKKEADILIDVINGDEEAQFIYEGVKWSGAIKERSLIMDIGGGSTEFMLCDDERLIWKKSYNIGAARLMQQFFKSDPINQQERHLLNNYLEKELEELVTKAKAFQPQCLIGSAGAFETYSEMTNPSLDLTKLSFTNLDYYAYLELSEKLITSNHQERSMMQGLIPLRVDMIVMASILTNYVLHQIDIREIKLSTYDLKMGVLHCLSL